MSGWVREMGGRGMDVQKMAKELVKAAYKRGSDDNITVIVVDLACLAQPQSKHRTTRTPLHQHNRACSVCSQCSLSVWVDHRFSLYFHLS